jgi:hypothetical protein
MPNKHISAEDLAFTDFVELYEADPRQAETRLVMLLIDDDAAVLRYAMLNRIKSAALAAGFPEPEYLKQDHSAALAALAEVGVLSAIRNRGFTFEQLLPFVSDPELLCQAYEAVCEVPLFEEPGEPTEEDEAGDQQEAMGGVMVVAETPMTGQMDSWQNDLTPVPVRRQEFRATAYRLRGTSQAPLTAGAPAAATSAAAPPAGTADSRPQSGAFFQFVGQPPMLRVTLIGDINELKEIRVRIMPALSLLANPILEGVFEIQREESAVFVDIPDVPQDKGELRVEVTAVS